MPGLYSVPDKEAILGRVLNGRYRLEKVLGEGGVGVVYRAQHVKLKHTVAVKILSGASHAHPDVRKRFEREARALSSLSHPNIVGVTDFGVDNDLVYIAMEFLEGQTLADVIHDELILPPERAVELARQILEGLAFAHGRGVLHRDLKPANVFLQVLPNGTEHVKLLDFGLAKLISPDLGAKNEPTLTRDGAILGTPAYMAPEQASGSRVDLRADVYSVGVLLFEMLAGRCPFVASNYIDVLHGHLFEPVPSLYEVNPQVVASPELEHLLKRSMAKTPSDRFTDAGDMLRALQGLTHPITQRPPSNVGVLHSANHVNNPPRDLVSHTFALEQLQGRPASLEATQPVRHYRVPRGRSRILLGAGGGFLVTLLILTVTWAASELLSGNSDEEKQPLASAEPSPKPQVSNKPRNPPRQPQPNQQQANQPQAAGDAKRPKASPEKVTTQAQAEQGSTVTQRLAGTHPDAYKLLVTGESLPLAMVQQLEGYAKKHRRSEVTSLALGHHAFLRERYDDAFRYYKKAVRINDEAKSYEAMQTHMVHLSGEDKVYRRARKLAMALYGAELLPQVEKVIDKSKISTKKRNRLRRLRSKLKKLR